MPHKSQPAMEFNRRLGGAIAGLALGMLLSCERPAPAPPDAGTPDTSEPGDTAATGDDRYDQALARPTPRLPEPLAEAFGLIRTGRTGPARVRLRKRIDADPRDGLARFLFGLSYHEEKNYAEARPHLAAAAELAPDYAPIRYFHGWCLYYLGEGAAAQAEFLAHLEAQPREPDTHFALGLIAFDAGDLPEARRCLGRALRYAPPAMDDPRLRSKILARLAEVDLAEGDLPAAISRLDEATTIFPDHYEAWTLLERARRRAGDETGAAAAAEAAAAARARVRPTAPPPPAGG